MAVLLGLGWAVGLSIIEPGAASMSLTLSNISFLAPFTVVLVAVPATVGGVLAGTLSRTG